MSACPGQIYAKFKAGFSPLRRLFKAMDADANGKLTTTPFISIHFAIVKCC